MGCLDGNNSHMHFVRHRQNRRITAAFWRLMMPLLVILVALLIQGCKEVTEKKAAADFTLQLFNGQTFTLSKHKGEVVIVNFFASWCLPCRSEAPALEAVNSQYIDKKVVFVGIAFRDSDSTARDFVKTYGLSFPTGLDSDEKIGKALGVYGLPTTFFIDRNGLVNYTHAGAVTEELIRYELDKIL